MTRPSRLPWGKRRVTRKYIDQWDRALRFLVEHGRIIGNTDGHSIIVDHASYLIGELPELAARLHRDDWLASGNAFVDSLLKPTPEAQGD